MESIFSLTALTVAAIPLDMGLITAARQVGLPAKFAPLMSIIFGIGLVALTGASWQADIAQGIIVGLAASGLWSGSRTMLLSSKASRSSAQ
jgi:hypothetical protein